MILCWQPILPFSEGIWRKMTIARRFFTLLILIAVSLPSPVCASATKDDFVFCENIIHKWSKSSSDDDRIQDKSTLKDLLFFLHVPRTGGRTYFHCFLRKLYKGEQECPRSYDKLRFDPSKEKCHLMVTHDDYSFMSKLSKERTSVVTILRNPIDRVFSTYEFSLEVAARFLVHPNLTSATQMSIRLRPKSRDVSTLDIWPWKYLVPWMRKDLFARRDARKFNKAAVVYATGDPYSMKEMVMPLLDFINDPISHDIVHNGATFQVAGLTNNSGFAEAHEVRHCVRKHPSLGHYILKVAKKRLDNMLYVGLTEEHKKSAIMFANMVGAQVLSQNASSSYFLQNAANSSGDSHSAGSDVTESSTVTVSESKVPSEDFKDNENMTVGKLMKAYEACTSGLRKTQATRRTMSLKQVAPANFSKKARKLVPQTVLQQILMLNNLDVELYKHAQGIFERQYKHIEQSTGDEQIHNIFDSAMKRNKSGCFLGYSQWDVFLIAAASFLFIFLIYLFLTRSRQASKLKI